MKVDFFFALLGMLVNWIYCRWNC